MMMNTKNNHQHNSGSGLPPTHRGPGTTKSNSTNLSRETTMIRNHAKYIKKMPTCDQTDFILFPMNKSE